MNIKVACLLFVCLLVLIAFLTWYFTKDSSKPTTATPLPIAPSVVYQPLPPANANAAGWSLDFNAEQPPIMEGKDIALTEFTFENLTMPSYVPDARTRMVRKPAGNPPYKLVNCNVANAYAIRWNGRFLNMYSPNKFEWKTNKEEPDGCFTIVPGYCGGNGKDYVMLRSTMNRHFLRIDEGSGMLICKDTPTARTAEKYCWKLRDTDASTKMPCGPQYSEDLKRVIDIPCTILQEPLPGKGCSSVTKGFVAKCCGVHPDDPECRGSYWREVVGRQLTESILYLKTRRPDLKVQPCPHPCTKNPFPEYDETTVMIPYDTRSGFVTAPAFRFI